jgi:hypothetical protein
VFQANCCQHKWTLLLSKLRNATNTISVVFWTTLRMVEAFNSWQCTDGPSMRASHAGEGSSAGKQRSHRAAVRLSIRLDPPCTHMLRICDTPEKMGLSQSVNHALEHTKSILATCMVVAIPCCQPQVQHYRISNTVRSHAAERTPLNCHRSHARPVPGAQCHTARL